MKKPIIQFNWKCFGVAIYNQEGPGTFNIKVLSIQILFWSFFWYFGGVAK